MSSLPPVDDQLWRDAQPLVHKALQGFGFFDSLKFSTTFDVLLVSSTDSLALQRAADRMLPVFRAAGWGYRSEFRGSHYRRLAFTRPLPKPPVARSNFRVIR